MSLPKTVKSQSIDFLWLSISMETFSSIYLKTATATTAIIVISTVLVTYPFAIPYHPNRKQPITTGKVAM